MQYYDIRANAHRHEAINIIIGGRGIGKTYSALSYMIEMAQPFLYLRNTGIQMEESATAFGNPFKKISLDMGRDISLKAEKRHYNIIETTSGSNEIIGYGAALSTFSNLRGVDLSDVRYVVFDEFIERRKLAFDQFGAFQAMYETVNRNRELEGEPPLKCFLLSNSQTLQNDILMGYGLVDRIQRMIVSGERIWRRDGLYLELPKSEISEAKARTANYKLISGTDYAREALENEFTSDSYKNVVKRDINEYRPLCYAERENDAIFFWRHKARPEFYATQIPSMHGRKYESDEYPLFFKQFGLALREAAIRGNLYYQTYECKLHALNLLNLTKR